MTKEGTIRAYLEEKCATVRNFRGWDYMRIMTYGEFKPTDWVLDTGAYHTYFSIFLCQYVAHIIATDSYHWAERDYIQEQKLPSPKEWEREIVELGGSKVSAGQADVRDLDYKDGVFNKVLSISTIEHIQDDVQAMHEMIRVLRPGGLLLLTTELGLTHKPYSEEDGSYYRIYDLSQLFRLLTCVPDTELLRLETSGHLHDEEVTGKEFTTVFAKVRKNGKERTTLSRK